MSSFAKYLMVALKGACMGAADVIPGVSGGTIAFMMGIYEELVGSIKSLDLKALKLFLSGKFGDFWKYINGNFLLAVFAGILASVLSLAKLMQYLLNTFPIHTWGFFFGLIVASSWLIIRGIKDWKLKDFAVLLLGIALGIIVCTLKPTNTPDDIWFIFICGSVAICAMILPGISGSFILLILGKYEFVMATISNLLSGVDVGHNVLVLGVFAIGALIGIVAFSKFLNWLLSSYHRMTLLSLVGFIIGSLVVIWPWSHTEEISQMHIPGGCLAILAGLALVFLIEFLGKRKRKALN